MLIHRDIFKKPLLIAFLISFFLYSYGNSPIEKMDCLQKEFLPHTTMINDDVVWENIIDGVRLFHEERLARLKPLRENYWNRDLHDEESYSLSVEPNRKNFRNILGNIDQREDVEFEKTCKVSETSKYVINEIKWTVLKEIVQIGRAHV